MGKCSSILGLLWTAKSLITLPLGSYLDVMQAIKYFRAEDVFWGVFTVIFILLPSIYLVNIPFFSLWIQTLKLAWLKCKMVYHLFQDQPLDQHLQDQEIKLSEQKNAKVYFQDIPHYVLKLYFLWKTPVGCFFTWNLEDCKEGIFTWNPGECFDQIFVLYKFFSIAGSVVPYYRKKKKEDWETLSIGGVAEILLGTLLFVIPKLTLMAWTFSVLHWYGWIFIIPIFIVILLLSRCGCINQKEATTWKEAYILLPLQIVFGYCGFRNRNVIVTNFILWCYLIPLNIALNASSKTTFNSAIDHFSVFPNDRFPSRTICFTNESILQQMEKWQNFTEPFSENCNMSVSALPCSQEEKVKIDVLLSVMLVFMCFNLAGFLVLTDPGVRMGLLVLTVFMLILVPVVAVFTGVGVGSYKVNSAVFQNIGEFSDAEMDAINAGEPLSEETEEKFQKAVTSWQWIFYDVILPILAFFVILCCCSLRCR